jgi:hypothetical protein
MPTEIKVLFSEKESFEKLFYCVESPYEVLKELFGKYHVRQFNSLETKWATLQPIPAKSAHKELQFFNSNYIEGLSVKKAESKNGIEITGNLKDYNPGIPFNQIYVDKGKEILYEFIEKYLITKEIIESGYATKNYDHQEKIHKYGRQKAIEYLKQRDKEKDSKKEENLEDILDYGRVVLGEKMNIKMLKKLSRKIAREIPKKIDPTHIDYFTLRPDSHLVFSSGPKLR